MNPELQYKIFMTVFVASISVYFVRTLYFGFVSSKWPITQAIATKSHVEKRNVYKGGTAYVPVIEYKYTVGSKNFTSSRLTYSGLFGTSKKHADEQVSYFPKGRKFNTYYNPKKPQQSVLVTGVHWLNYLAIIVTLSIFVGLFYLLEILNYIWPGCQPNCI